METNTTTLPQATHDDEAGSARTPAGSARTNRCAWWLCVASFAALSAAPAAAADDGFVAAMHAYDDGRYALAYGRLVSLADAGHPEAARIALMMLRYGPQLYGTQWSATPGQIDRWLAAAGTPQPTLVAEGGD